MIEFRDRYTAELGLKLIVHKNRSALDEGANPFAWGTQRCCGALEDHRAAGRACEKAASTRLSAAPVATKRSSRAKERVFSFRDIARPVGSAESAPGTVEPL